MDAPTHYFVGVGATGGPFDRMQQEPTDEGR